MAFVLLRLFYGIYFLGSAIVFYNLISCLLFQKSQASIHSILKQIGLALVWPLALFSGVGRKKIFKLMRRL